MATYNKFNATVLDLVNGAHQFATHSYKTMLVNSPAPVATNSIKSDLTEVANGNGYTTGGIAVTITTAQVTGTATVKTLTNPLWTGTTVSPSFTFHYAVLYNDTQTTPSKPLVAWWDYGSSQQVNIGETLTVDYDDSAGIFTVT